MNDPISLRFSSLGVLMVAFMAGESGWLDPVKLERMEHLAELYAGTDDDIWDDPEWKQLYSDVREANHNLRVAAGGIRQAVEKPPRGPFYDHPYIQELREGRSKARKPSPQREAVQ
jgi:hypothetical protein